MIEFNLLPDVKLAYIKSKRTVRLVILSAVSVTSVAVAVFLLLFLSVNVVQKRSLKNIENDITKNSKTLEAIPDLNKILTIQNQLNTLPDLHNKKPVTTRFATYIQQVTPAQTSLAKVDVDFVTYTMNIGGATDSLVTVNKFVDTLKFTTFKATPEGPDAKAFSDVVLGTFGRDDKGASFQITLKYNPEIFSASTTAVLTVPKLVTTRSEVDKPGALPALFEPLKNTKVGN